MALAARASHRREDERLRASWLGGRDQVAQELIKLDRILGIGGAGTGSGVGGAPPVTAAGSSTGGGGAGRNGDDGGAGGTLATLPADIANAVAAARGRPFSMGNARDEAMRIERFLQRQHVVC